MRLVFPAAFRPLQSDDTAAVINVRNEMRFLRSFLSHYRQLGVTRFVFVDDQSEDGTQEFLSSQPDVDVWVSGIRFGEAERGIKWREWLFRQYGFDRWYLNLDVDEYLVYDGAPERSLSTFIGLVEKAGFKRVAGPMIDMYPAGVLADFHFSGEDDTPPWHVATHFDGEGYVYTLSKRLPGVAGGPRQRRFGIQGQLMKFPLIYWDEDCSLGTSIHAPVPYERNLVPISCVLLHFKFFSDLNARIVSAIEDGQHYDGGKEYRMMESGNAGNLSFMSDTSIPYNGARQMKELGFMRGF